MSPYMHAYLAFGASPEGCKEELYLGREKEELSFPAVFYFISHWWGFTPGEANSTYSWLSVAAQKSGHHATQYVVFPKSKSGGAPVCGWGAHQERQRGGRGWGSLRRCIMFLCGFCLIVYWFLPKQKLWSILLWYCFENCILKLKSSISMHFHSAFSRMLVSVPA